MREKEEPLQMGGAPRDALIVLLYIAARDKSAAQRTVFPARRMYSTLQVSASADGQGGQPVGRHQSSIESDEGEVVDQMWVSSSNRGDRVTARLPNPPRQPARRCRRVACWCRACSRKHSALQFPVVVEAGPGRSESLAWSPEGAFRFCGRVRGDSGKSL